jgi:hypothetical protein
MEDRALFCDIDFLAAKHRVNPPSQTGLLGKLQQKLEGFVGYAVLRIIEIEPDSLNGEAFGALWVLCEEVAEMDSADLFGVGLESLPGWTASKW